MLTTCISNPLCSRPISKKILKPISTATLPLFKSENLK